MLKEGEIPETGTREVAGAVIYRLGLLKITSLSREYRQMPPP